MLKDRIILISIISVALVVSLFMGCGAAPAGSDNAELEAAREQIEELENQLSDAQAKIATLQQQILDLGAESELAGDTPEETAKNIIEQYHETHTYSRTDLFVCADMAMGVWNMLQAQGIDAVIQIGDIQKAVVNMQDSGHAWVLAEVAPGQNLALETTNGQVVTRSENPLYYAGWSFDNPAEYKRFEELKYEHNIRVEVYNSLVEDNNQVVSDYNAAVDAYNSMADRYDSGQATTEQVNEKMAVMEELKGRQNQLQLLIAEQQQELDKIPPQMQSLAQ
ncbi:hypothetical protein ACFLTB_03590 [Chloroflexota bacterium]